jgi:hypothetical protein
VVHEEHGVIWAAEEVACVAADGEVASSVEPEEALVETAL